MLVAVLLLVLSTAQAGATCPSVDDCRRQALAAESAGDYETFHDLAWRAVQKARPNDPGLMYMLARAMSESGRPGDALVMLSRLADMGVKIDVSGEAFRRVRALKGWPALEARLSGAPTPLPAAAKEPEEKASPTEAAAEPATAEPVSVPAAPMSPAASAPESVPAPSGEPFEFDTPPFDPAGLAYDEVSRRFVVGDRRASRLVIVDESTHRLTPLVGAASAGFYDTLTGFDVDHRRGDLWVVSAQGDGDSAESILHKLQLVSGRVLSQVPTDRGVRLVDVAVTGDGTVYALDANGGRLLRLQPGSHALDVVQLLGIAHPASLAVGDDRVAYVASPSGIARVDLASHAVTPLTAPGAMGDVEVIRSHGRSLFVVERRDGVSRLTRLTLDSSGRAVVKVLPLDTSLPPSTAAAIVGNTFYYLSGRGQIRAIKLR